MVICKYYQEGRCRYGNNCKYEHIDPPEGGSSRSDPFSTPTRGQGRHSNSKPADQQPQWPITAIGSKENVEQGNDLTGDLSPEELRVLAYSMAPRGMSADVTRREGQLVAEHQAKVDALLRGGMQTGLPGTGSNGFQVKDPFAQNPSAPAQQVPGFGGAANMKGGAAQQQNPFGNPPPQQNPFGQPPQQQQNPFGQAPPPQQQGQFGAPAQPQANAYAQNAGFAQPAPQAPAQNSAPVASSGQDPQFSAAQFGFAKVPEAAPPPKYY